ncbi:MAG: glycosyltransferase [Eubacterium sp.]
MRILHMIPDIGISNGVMSVILNYFKAMPEDIKFDVVYFQEMPATRQKDIEALLGRVFKISPPSLGSIKSREIKRFFDEHEGEWSALHIHAPHFAVFIAPEARRHGIDKIAVHCHSTWYSLKDNNKKRNKLLQKAGRPFCDVQLACGTQAGRFWYKNDKSFTVLPNAVDCDAFRFNASIREKKRDEMGLSDCFAVGHLGRVSPPQKNHPFLIEIFAQIKKERENAVLLLAGAEETPELAELSKRLGVYDSVRFLGSRTDIKELLQAFDVFIFPSFWEGLPVSVVEAQAAGLPVLMSDSITDEVCVTDNIHALSLDTSAEQWAKRRLR